MSEIPLIIFLVVYLILVVWVLRELALASLEVEKLKKRKQKAQMLDKWTNEESRKERNAINSGFGQTVEELEARIEILALLKDAERILEKSLKETERPET